MNFNDFKVLLIENFNQNHVDQYATDQNISLFYDLTNIMLEKNQVMNITAIREVEKIIPLHYADCLKIAEHIPEGSKVIDIGCGGGFPTLPLAIVRPDIQILGVDSTDKKVKYVAETAKSLNLTNVSTISARAEVLISLSGYRESFDVAVSRAVARLCVLDELCLPFVRIGGQFIVMKGSAGQEELDEAQNGIEKLGGKVINTIQDELTVTDETEKRVMFVIEKTHGTPTQYPRQFGQIKKKPL